MKDQKGIAFIALLLIMLVLIVLAGISIALYVNEQIKNETPNNVLNYDNSYNDNESEIIEDYEYDTEENIENDLDNNSDEENTSVEEDSNVTENINNETEE